MDACNYKKVRASELPQEERDRLRKSLHHDLAEQLIKSIKVNPPDVDLSAIDIVLKPNQQLDEWKVVADCGTCSTCGTCGTCRTCGTSSHAGDIPISVIRELGAETRPVVDLARLKDKVEQISSTLVQIEEKNIKLDK